MESHCFALLCIALHCFALHCIALLCFALLCIALHCFALLCIALHCFALLCTLSFEGLNGKLTSARSTLSCCRHPTPSWIARPWVKNLDLWPESLIVH